MFLRVVIIHNNATWQVHFKESYCCLVLWGVSGLFCMEIASILWPIFTCYKLSSNRFVLPSKIVKGFRLYFCFFIFSLLFESLGRINQRSIKLHRKSIKNVSFFLREVSLFICSIKSCGALLTNGDLGNHVKQSRCACACVPWPPCSTVAFPPSSGLGC